MSNNIQVKYIHANGLSRISNVQEIVPISTSGLWKWVKEGKFPQPIKVGRATFWRNSDILHWLEQNGFRQAQE